MTRWLRAALYLLVLVGLDRELDPGWHWPTAVLLGFVFLVVLTEWALAVRRGHSLGPLRTANWEGESLVLVFDGLQIRLPASALQPVHGGFRVKAAPFSLFLASKKLPVELLNTLQRPFL
ncbi:hypothetical protein [Gallaecimonas xiamenensis]|uniref:Uncharacterized protein n=1 Tax=Gallaecimonas xiamenensis 3-C-1 TaxID=745411 RepID=K2JRD8_9GAMM|nr:hypothetical protein [Gallaecimonas xiamenensis]EKE77963.1 hypothetical protein B3C1_00845 [Gallaecimonas xiamenensis 3-C-1]